MFVAAVMVAFSALMTWLPYRAWRKGVITVRTITSRRAKEPRRFALDLAFTSAFAALCWIGTAAIIYRLLHPH